jgi:hypothetical protein
LPTQAVGSGGTNYATGATYWPQGALDQDVHGQVSGGFGGITETWGYNSDLEPTSIVASSSAGTALSLSYAYAGNGSVTGINNNASGQSGRNESITYDPLNRILAAETAATSGQDCWGLDFGDDQLGNLLSMTPAKCSGPSLGVSVSNNKISNAGFSYNADGQLTADGTNDYAYNGANEVTSAGGVNYIYDGDGLRVEKSSGTLYWPAQWAGGQACVYWPGARDDQHERHDDPRLHLLRWQKNRVAGFLRLYPLLFRRRAGLNASGNGFERQHLLRGRLLSVRAGNHAGKRDEQLLTDVRIRGIRV